MRQILYHGDFDGEQWRKRKRKLFDFIQFYQLSTAPAMVIIKRESLNDVIIIFPEIKGSKASENEHFVLLPFPFSPLFFISFYKLRLDLPVKHNFTIPPHHHHHLSMILFCKNENDEDDIVVLFLNQHTQKDCEREKKHYSVSWIFYHIINNYFFLHLLISYSIHLQTQHHT